MNNTKKIKKNYEFKYVFNKGQRYSAKYINAYICKNNRQFNKFGISISKKYGKAVKRNLAKRLVREGYKVFENKLNDYYNIVILFNIIDENIDFKAVYKDLQTILIKAGCIDEKLLD